MGPQQIHRQVVTVVGGHAQGVRRIRTFRVSAEGRQYSSDVTGEWLTALQGSVALGIDGVRQQRHVAEDLVWFSADGRRPSQGLRIVVLDRVMGGCPVGTHHGIPRHSTAIAARRPATVTGVE
ncbi:hypothetical protein ACFVTC_30095 [Streptomyces sp. NPDC057950]|uniref:hypothetical protein n=1 Tax=Streptomyces sp. NPDC057950 TaxID=3346288 RepID=UPI0036E5F281